MGFFSPGMYTRTIAVIYFSPELVLGEKCLKPPGFEEPVKKKTRLTSIVAGVSRTPPPYRGTPFF